MPRLPVHVLRHSLDAGKIPFFHHVLTDGPPPAVGGPTGRLESPTTSARVVDGVADASAIYDAQLNVVVLRRTLSAELAREAREAVREGFRTTGIVARGEAGRGELSRLLPSSPHLASDVHSWVEVLADLTGCERVGVRVARADSATCPRLHVDDVTLRVVCTFEGTGTEYVGNEHLDRRWLGHAAAGAADEVSGLLRAPSCIQSAGVGDVVFLKGEAWPDNAGRGAVHRSPAASASAPRLVMTLDPLG